MSTVFLFLSVQKLPFRRVRAEEMDLNPRFNNSFEAKVITLSYVALLPIFVVFCSPSRTKRRMRMRRKMTITVDLSVLAWATRGRTRGAGVDGGEEEGSEVEVEKVGDSGAGEEERGASEVGVAVDSEGEEAMEVGLGGGVGRVVLGEGEERVGSGAEEGLGEGSTEMVMKEAMGIRALEGTEEDSRASEVVVVVGSETITMKGVTEDSPQEEEEDSGVEGVALGEGEGALVGVGGEGLAVVAQV